MSKRRILYVAHNHPSVRPGGAETYALELYEAIKTAGQFEPIFLAKSGPPMSNTPAPSDGQLLSRVNADPNQYFLYTDAARHNDFYGVSRDKDICVDAFAGFLRDQQPEIVHFQHTHLLGYDLIRQVKTTLPDARILYTLHEYLPICHHHGQMLRTNCSELCRKESPTRCHECFPGISPQEFFLRKRFIQSHFALVDRFLAPSLFLLERFVEWGIPRDRIVFEEYGRHPVAPATECDGATVHDRLGFFGQFSHYKGVNVLLRAMQLLAKNHLWLHGANLELQPPSFQNEFNALLESNGARVTLGGRYAAADVPRLMAGIDWVVVPSIWWENSPLVIQEAFMHRRPVICSNIGGMAEKVANGVNGLHFSAGDPVSLADTLRRAVDTPGLWGKLRGGIAPIYSIAESAQRLTGLYEELLK